MGAGWRRVFRPPSWEDIAALGLAWRWWVLTGLMGAVLGALAVWALPAPYRARAEVVVDFDLEEARPLSTDNELFLFLDREDKKLRALAWSDQVLQEAARAAGEAVAPSWWRGALSLREEGDGTWYFWADAASPAQAQRLAAAWAQSFLQVAQEKIALARRELALRRQAAALAQHQADVAMACRAAANAQRLLASWQPTSRPWDGWRLAEALAWLNRSGEPLPAAIAQPGPEAVQAARAVAADRVRQCQPLQEQLAAEQQRLQQRLDALAAESGAISPYLRLAPKHLTDLPVQRKISLAWGVVVGALLGLAVGLAAALFWGGRSHE